MKLLKVICLLFLISMIGCNKNESPVSPDNTAANAGVILPLAVGNEWIYIDSVFTAAGTPESIDTVKLGISGKTNIVYQGKSVEVFYWNWYDGNQPDELKWLCRNEDGGCYSYGLQMANNKFLPGKTQWLKYPVNVGDSWEMVSYAVTDSTTYTVDTILYSCRSVTEKFKTLKGEMECHVYYSRSDAEGHKYEQFMYFAKNVGYVGFIYKVDDVINEKYTLLSYSFSGNPSKSSPCVNGKSNRNISGFPLRSGKI